MPTELAFVLCTVLFFLIALATAMGIPLYIFTKQDRKQSELARREELSRY